MIRVAVLEPRSAGCGLIDRAAELGWQTLVLTADRDERRVLAYLHRTVVNEVRSRHRHRLVVRRDAHLFRPDDAHDPTVSHDDRAAVQQALAALPPRQRAALVLRYWMDLPLAEIAEVMGVRLGTVKSQVSRALDVLGRVLREEVGR